MNTSRDPFPSVPTPLPEWLAIVHEKVKNLRFGVVQIVVHEAKVTQIERTEKTRLAGPQED